jgi:hypothetical protein
MEWTVIRMAEQPIVHALTAASAACPVSSVLSGDFSPDLNT